MRTRGNCVYSSPCFFARYVRRVGVLVSTEVVAGRLRVDIVAVQANAVYCADLRPQQEQESAQE